MWGSTSLRRGGCFLSFFLFILFFLAFWVLISCWICPQRHKAVFGKRQLCLPSPFVMLVQLGLKAQTTAHPWGRAALLLLNCFKVPVCDMKHAIKWIYSRCPSEFPLSSTIHLEAVHAARFLGPCCLSHCHRSTVRAHLGLHFGGDHYQTRVVTPGSAPCSVGGRFQPLMSQGVIALHGIGGNASLGLGVFVLQGISPSILGWGIPILGVCRISVLRDVKLLGSEALHRQGWWIPILRVRSSVLEVCGSLSLNFGDLHLQGWEIPFLGVGRIPSLGVMWFFLVFCGAPSLSVFTLRVGSISPFLGYEDLLPWVWRKIFNLGAGRYIWVGRPPSWKVLHLQLWVISTHVCPWREDLCPPSWLKPWPTASSIPQHPHCSGTALGQAAAGLGWWAPLWAEQAPSLPASSANMTLIYLKASERSRWGVCLLLNWVFPGDTANNFLGMLCVGPGWLRGPWKSWNNNRVEGNEEGTKAKITVCG